MVSYERSLNTLTNTQARFILRLPRRAFIGSDLETACASGVELASPPAAALLCPAPGAKHRHVSHHKWRAVSSVYLITLCFVFTTDPVAVPLPVPQRHSLHEVQPTARPPPHRAVRRHPHTPHTHTHTCAWEALGKTRSTRRASRLCSRPRPRPSVQCYTGSELFRLPSSVRVQWMDAHAGSILLSALAGGTTRESQSLPSSRGLAAEARRRSRLSQQSQSRAYVSPNPY